MTGDYTASTKCPDPYRITYYVKRKYNGNENGHRQIYQFPFQIFPFCFRFVSLFRNFCVSVFVSVNGIKIFPLTDVSVAVNVNHTAVRDRI